MQELAEPDPRGAELPAYVGKSAAGKSTSAASLSATTSTLVQRHARFAYFIVVGGAGGSHGMCWSRAGSSSRGQPLLELGGDDPLAVDTGRRRGGGRADRRSKNRGVEQPLASFGGRVVGDHPGVGSAAGSSTLTVT